MMAGRGKRATPRKDPREDYKHQLEFSRCLSSSGDHDPSQLFFTNLLLLGFDADGLEAETRIPFNKSMFNLPNKRGAEYVLHFLLTRLDPVICKKEFRDCWPVSDKKQEQRFRSICYNWISAIAKEPDAHLPRINATILMSPGGSKFISFIMHFSRYVLYKVDEKENGVNERLEFSMLSKKNNFLAATSCRMLSCATVQAHRDYEDTMLQMINHEEMWTKAANNAVKEIRKLSKEIREKEHRIREETLKSTELTHNTSSSMPRKPSNLDMSYDYQASRRAQDVQEVRHMWQQIDNFCTKHRPEIDVVESIVDRAVTKHRISAADISIKVSDLLLRECAQEIRRNHIENTYQNGKLNLVSLLQLWNLSMKMFIERYHQAGVPDFTNDLSFVTDNVHKHHGCLSTLEWLGEEVSKIKPEVKVSVKQLLRRERDRNSGSTPDHQTRPATSVGMGLLPPAPKYSFSPQGGSGTTPQIQLQRTPEFDTTPDAVLAIRQSIAQQVKDMRLHENAVRECRVDLFNTQSQQSKSAVKNRNLPSNLPKKAARKPVKSRTDHIKRSSKTVDVREQQKAVPRSSMRPDTYGAEKETVIPGQGRNVITMVQTTSSESQMSPDTSDMSRLSDLSRTLVEHSEASSVQTTPRLADRESFPRLHGSHHHPKSPSDYIVDEVLGLRSPSSPQDEEIEIFERRELPTQTFISENRDGMFYNSETNRDLPNSDVIFHDKEIPGFENDGDLQPYNTSYGSTDYNSPLRSDVGRGFTSFHDMVSLHSSGVASPSRPDMVSPQRSSVMSPHGSDREKTDLPEVTDLPDELTDLLEGSDKENQTPEHLFSRNMPSFEPSSPNSNFSVESAATKGENDVVIGDTMEGQTVMSRSWHLTPSPVHVQPDHKAYSPPTGKEKIDLVFPGFDTDLVKGEALDDIQEPYLSFTESPKSTRKSETGKTLPQLGDGDFERNSPLKSHLSMSFEEEANPISDMSNGNNNLPVSSETADVNSNHCWTSSESTNIKRNLSLELNWQELEEMESTMKNLDDMVGKPKDNDLSPSAVDLDLDDSFVPLKDGFQLEGGTPLRITGQSRDDPMDDNRWLLDTSPLTGGHNISPLLGEHSSRPSPTVQTIRLDQDRVRSPLQTMRLDQEQDNSDHWARIQALREKTKRIMESMAEHDA